MTAPATPTVTVTALDAIDILSNEWAWGPDQASALAAVRALVEAVSVWRKRWEDGPDYDADLALISAHDAYLKWGPQP